MLDRAVIWRRVRLHLFSHFSKLWRLVCEFSDRIWMYHPDRSKRSSTWPNLVLSTYVATNSIGHLTDCITTSSGPPFFISNSNFEKSVLGFIDADFCSIFCRTVQNLQYVHTSAPLHFCTVPNTISKFCLLFFAKFPDFLPSCRAIFRHFFAQRSLNLEKSSNIFDTLTKLSTSNLQLQKTIQLFSIVQKFNSCQTSSKFDQWIRQFINSSFWGDEPSFTSILAIDSALHEAAWTCRPPAARPAHWGRPMLVWG